MQSSGFDLVDACGAVHGKSYGDCGDGQIADSECIGDFEADLRSGDCDMNGLSDRSVDEDGIRGILHPVSTHLPQ